MMDENERAIALAKMRDASNAFYRAAFHIGNHPFIEFTGLLNEYIQAAERAHREGIDFSECNKHNGAELPIAPHEIAYLNEKLDCIFTGRIALRGEEKPEPPSAPEIANAARVMQWARQANRKPANSAFTAGAERQAAYWIEWAETEQRNAAADLAILVARLARRLPGDDPLRDAALTFLREHGLASALREGDA